MERKVNIQDWQKVTVEDFNNFGLFPRGSFDHIVVDTLIPGMAFTGFNVVQDAPAVVTVGSGRLYHNGLVFYNDNEGGTNLDLLGVLPVVTRRYVGVVVWGQEIDTDTEPRTFLTDPVTRATVARVVSTESRRWTNISTVVGPEGPDPQRPAIASNTLVVAWILLDSTGIVSITMVDENRAPNVANLDARLDENDAWRQRTASRLDTLATDLAALAARLAGTASLKFTLKLGVDIARVKEVLNLPDTYSMWGADHFLTEDESDALHVDYIARVDEGIRFPPEAQRDAQIGLLNPLDENVVNQANFILPKYSEVSRLEILGNDGEISISQYQFQTISWELCAKTRTRIRWGTPIVVCSNSYWWYAPAGYDYGTGFLQSQGNGIGGYTPNTDLIYDPLTNILRRGDETFQILDVMDNPNHTVLRIVQFWVDEIIDSYYWRQVVTVEGLSGSVVAQTFLNSQGGWLTSVDLFFTRVAATGDVHCLIVECGDNGAPNYQRTIARTTLTVDLMRTLPNYGRFKFLPTYLAKGKRYAVVLQTAGNHFISIVNNNKFAQGSMFTSTDGAWATGDLVKDFAMRLNFAKFDTNRCTVQLLSLELNGGIAIVDLNFDSTRPPGTTISFEIQHNGVWKPLGYYDTNPLVALPPLLPFRVVLAGTTDEMPGIGVASNSRALTERPRSDFRHISKARTVDMSGTVNTVYCDFRLEGWRDAPYHTFTPRLLTGAGYTSVRTPSIIENELDPNDPTVLVRRCTWNLAALGGAAINSYKIRVEGTTDNVLSCFLVGERVDIGVNV